MDVLVHTDSSWDPKAAGWEWTSRHGSGLMQSKAVWVSFILFHRWEIKAQEGIPTCTLGPPSDHPSCSSSNTEAMSTEGWVCTYLLAHLLPEEWHLLGYSGRSVLVVGWKVCGAQGQDLENSQRKHPRCSISPCSDYVPQQGSSARQNTCVRRQPVPKQLQESSSWPLIYSEVGLGGLILLLWKPRRMKGQEDGGLVTAESAVGAEERGRF